MTDPHPPDAVVLRDATPEDGAFLAEMLYEAALPGVGDRPPKDEVLAVDEIARYLDDWGRPGDEALVACRLAADGTDGAPLGAAWFRVFPSTRAGYGWFDAGTPELTIALVEGARGTGLGGVLLDALLARAAAAGFERISLSVAHTNERAAALYRARGFVPVADDGHSTTMLAPSTPTTPPAPA